MIISLTSHFLHYRHIYTLDRILDEMKYNLNVKIFLNCIDIDFKPYALVIRVFLLLV